VYLVVSWASSVRHYDSAVPTDRRSRASANAEPAPAKVSCGDPVLLAGLVFETAAGLRRAVVPAVERDNGLPNQSLDVLVLLGRTEDGKLRMSDLAAQTRLTPSGLTRAVDRLCEAGLVRRQACAEDRRGAYASLTGTGRQRVGAAMSCHNDVLGELLGALDSSERDLLAALLRRLLDRLA
jgi:MarR family transcriptional regulator, 2-MHQ and catechol-resistance regulon repressor